MTFEKLHGKSVLVTGATGFIGAHLVERLRAIPGVRMVLLSRKPPGAEAASGALHVTAALQRLTPEIWGAAGVERIDVVFHLGGFIPKTRDAAAANSIAGACEDNIEGTRRLLESLPSPPQRIVFAGTIDVYGPPRTEDPEDESAPLAPANLYGASKLFCEQLVRAFCRSLGADGRSPGCGSALLRYGHIFGPGEEAYEKLIPHTIRQLLRGEAPMLYGDGSTQRDLLYVGDAVEATLRAAVSDRQDLGPVNVVRGESRPIREIVELLARLTEFAGEIRLLRDRPAGPSFRYNSRLLRETLGEWPLVSLEEGLRREVEHVR